MFRELSPLKIGCLVLLLAVCLPCSRVEAQRTSLRQTRSYTRQGHVIVAPFANEGGTEDDDWIGIALQQVLQYKLSHEPAVQVYQYERYNPGRLRDYMMPVPGESLEARAAQLAETFARWPVVLGTFLREYTGGPQDDEILVQIYVMTGEAGSPKLVTSLPGNSEAIGQLLDGAIPPLLRKVLPWGATAGADWRGKMPTDSYEALQWVARGTLAAQEDADQAALCYQSAVDLDPSYLAARWAMVPMARMQRDTAGALEHVNVVAAAMPNDVQVRIARAAALSGVGNYMEAAREYQLCTKLNPRLERSLNQHIIRCYSRAGELDKALEWAQELLAADATNALALTLVGEVYEDRGEHDSVRGSRRARQGHRSLRSSHPAAGDELAGILAAWQLLRATRQAGRRREAVPSGPPAAA